MRGLIAPLMAATLVSAAVPGFAQGNPPADQIIHSLGAGGDLSAGGTRDSSLNARPVASPAPETVMRAAPDQAHSAPTRPGAPPARGMSAPSASLTVDFAAGSAQLTPQARATLDELGTAMNSSELARDRFRIEGHTDTVGGAADNRPLSERRAAAVVDYLTRKFRVQRARLEPVGMGEAGLEVPTPPQAPEPRNRRVRVVDLGP